MWTCLLRVLLAGSGLVAALYGAFRDEPRFVLAGMVLFVAYARVSRDADECD